MVPPAPRPALFDAPVLEGHALLDSGDGQKLERFGPVTLVRPDPQALWRPRRPELWKRAHLTFVRESDRGGHWDVGRGAPACARGRDAAWPVDVAGVRVEIRPTPFKHVGLFPEQAANWEWTREQRARFDEAPSLLNLFGYTGVASLLAARAGFRVTHVDASKASVSWLRRNLELSGLPSDTLRILCEDALRFVRREARRGVRYEGLLLDPPAYGRGPKGEKWVFQEGIHDLVAACGEILAERAFVALSSYAIGTSPLAMANLLEELGPGTVTAGELVLSEQAEEDPGTNESARRLPCGFCARWVR